MLSVGVLFNFFNEDKNWEPPYAGLLEFLFNYEPSGRGSPAAPCADDEHKDIRAGHRIKTSVPR
jgi:hypothetical protein